MKIIKNSMIYIAISLVLFIGSAFILLFGNLNLGIDMTGGIGMDYDYATDLDIDKINEEIA